MENYLSINIDFDAAEKITAATLKSDLELLISTSNMDYPPLFSADEQTEKKKVKKLIKAYRTVLEYYGVDEDDTES